MFCRKCGNRIPDTISFCPFCGTETASASVKTAEPAPAEEISEPAAPASAPVFEAPAQTPAYEAAPAFEAPAQAPAYEPAPAAAVHAADRKPPVFIKVPGPEPVKKSKKDLFIGMIIGFCVAALLAVLLFVWPGLLKGNEEPDNDTDDSFSISAEEDILSFPA